MWFSCDIKTSIQVKKKKKRNKIWSEGTPVAGKNTVLPKIPMKELCWCSERFTYIYCIKKVGISHKFFFFFCKMW